MSELEVIKTPTGYIGTPMLPGSEWHVHDPDRPFPQVIQPGQEPGQPPSDATVLFDGTGFDQWQARGGGPVSWRLVDGAMEVVPGSKQHIETKEHFGDCQLHVEWATPAVVSGESQGRGNSGVFMMGRYEIQVLDCYDNLTYADGHAAAIYGQYPPLVNASRGPAIWQTFEIFFIAPRFNGEQMESPAYVTVVHNGVLVQLHRPLMGPTRHKRAPAYDEVHDPTGPIMLQDHKNPVRFRNIWVRSIEGFDQV
jgi:hypothetical protein